MSKSIIDTIIQFLGIPQTSPDFIWTKTQAYQKRLDYVKSAWLIGGVVMLLIPHPAFIFASALFLLFLSFAFLDREEQGGE